MKIFKGGVAYIEFFFFIGVEVNMNYLGMYHAV